MTGQNFPLSTPARRARTTALAASAALGLSLALAACGEDSPEPTGSTPHVSSPSDSSGPSEPAGSPSASETPASGSAVGVYLVGDAAPGPRLFREFRRVKGDALLEAAKLVDGGDTLDPDYRTLWPGQTVKDVEQTDTTIEVMLNEDAFTEAPDGMGEDEATLAVQQMVHTLQGVAGERLPVHFVRTTGPEKLFGVDVSSPVKAAPWDDVLATVNVTTPAQDASLDRTQPLKASGVASAVEATVQWKVLQGEEQVLGGYATAEGWMDKLYPWETTVDVSGLEPGEYVFVAADSEEQGEGEEGFGPTEDSKTFTLR